MNKNSHRNIHTNITYENNNKTTNCDDSIWPTFIRLIAKCVRMAFVVPPSAQQMNDQHKRCQVKNRTPCRWLIHTQTHTHTHTRYCSCFCLLTYIFTYHLKEQLCYRISVLWFKLLSCNILLTNANWFRRYTYISKWQCESGKSRLNCIIAQLYIYNL